MKNIFNNYTIGAFLLGLLIATIGVAYVAKTQLDNERAKNKPQSYSESVQWMIEHPQYAETLKANYDEHMKAAEEAFTKSIGGDEDLGKE